MTASEDLFTGLGALPWAALTLGGRYSSLGVGRAGASEVIETGVVCRNLRQRNKQGSVVSAVESNTYIPLKTLTFRR